MTQKLVNILKQYYLNLQCCLKGLNVIGGSTLTFPKSLLECLSYFKQLLLGLSKFSLNNWFFLYPHHKMSADGYNGFALSRPSVGLSVRLSPLSCRLYKFCTNRMIFFKLDSNFHPNWAMCRTLDYFHLHAHTDL